MEVKAWVTLSDVYRASSFSSFALGQSVPLATTLCVVTPEVVLMASIRNLDFGIRVWRSNSSESTLEQPKKDSCEGTHGDIFVPQMATSRPIVALFIPANWDGNEPCGDRLLSNLSPEKFNHEPRFSPFQ